MQDHQDEEIQRLLVLLETLRREASRSFHRRLLVVAGDEAWCHDVAVRLRATLACEHGLWVGRSVAHGVPHVSNSKVSAFLGSETEFVIYDAFSGFDADAFGALSGTLVGGGLLILLAPKLTEWPAYLDPEHTRIAVAGTSPGEVNGRFIARLIRLIRADPSVTCIEQGRGLPETPCIVTRPYTADALDRDCRTRDQSDAVEAVIHVVRGHRRRPVVLISDRGRGKSSALGIAAARLLQAGRRCILVTAPRLRSAQSLFAQAARLLPSAKHGKGALHLERAEIRFCAPDQLLREPQPADLLLVDEAAALPTPLLEGLLEHYPRIAFATTVHGYEGTGQGFAVRFRRRLEQRFPQWREIRLETPVRWAPEDPLERWLFRALALDAGPAPLAAITPVRRTDCEFEILDRDRLATDDRDLCDLFGLLVLAHYRTSPYDLRHLLDGPKLKLFALRSHGRILAVAWVAEEGGFERSTAHAIWAGHRRPRGHLLAQSLGAHLGLEDAPCLHGARIVRIAVHPGLQRQGLGGRLLQGILEYGRTVGLDHVGASFGASEALLHFWQRSGFQPIRIGLHRGASSGTQSVIVLHALSSAGARLLADARARYLRQLPRLLAGPLSRMDADPALALLAGAPTAVQPPLNALDWRDLIGFAFARRRYETCLAAIQDLSLQALFESTLEQECARLLLFKVLQQRDWAECARVFGLSGRVSVEQALRRVTARLILHYGDAPVRDLALRIRARAPG